MRDIAKIPLTPRALFLASALACGSFLASAFAADGAEIYDAQCAQCHQADGQGAGPYPELAGNDVVLGAPDEVVRIVLHGRGLMPAFADVLDDEELTAVVNHVRTSFGNDAEPIDAEFVAEVRAESEDDGDAAAEASGDGDTASESVGDGDAAASAAAAESVEVDLPDDWFEQGAQLYLSFCSACHQPTGTGIDGAFPALAGNPFVVGFADQVVRVVLHGRAGMPAFGNGLDNEQIALIVSYIRTAWENEAHEVDDSMVETVRGGGDLQLEPTTPTTRPGAGD